MKEGFLVCIFLGEQWGWFKESLLPLLQPPFPNSQHPCSRKAPFQKAAHKFQMQHKSFYRCFPDSLASPSAALFTYSSLLISIWQASVWPFSLLTRTPCLIVTASTMEQELGMLVQLYSNSAGICQSETGMPLSPLIGKMVWERISLRYNCLICEMKTIYLSYRAVVMECKSKLIITHGADTT